MASHETSFDRRKRRVRAHLKRVVAVGRARLSVHRSRQHIYAQIIDDAKGVTLASASTLDREIRSTIKNGGNKDAALVVGRLVAERAIKSGIKDVIFDRGGYVYHGRVASLADAARESGLNF